MRTSNRALVVAAALALVAGCAPTPDDSLSQETPSAETTLGRVAGVQEGGLAVGAKDVVHRRA